MLTVFVQHQSRLVPERLQAQVDAMGGDTSDVRFVSCAVPDASDCELDASAESALVVAPEPTAGGIDVYALTPQPFATLGLWPQHVGFPTGTAGDPRLLLCAILGIDAFLAGAFADASRRFGDALLVGPPQPLSSVLPLVASRGAPRPRTERRRAGAL